MAPNPKRILLILFAIFAPLSACNNSRVISAYWELGEEPAQIGNTLFFTTSNYDVDFGVVAIDTQQERIEWIQPKAGFRPCKSIHADASTLFVDCEAVLSALDPNSGSILWRREMGAPLEQAPIILENRIIVVTQSDGSETRQLGPGHGAAILPSDDRPKIERSNGQSEAFVWRWMLDLPHPLAWGFMALEEPHGDTNPPTPSPDVHAQKPAPPNSGHEQTPAPEPFDPTPSATPHPAKGRAIVLDKHQGHLLTEWKGNLDVPLIQFGNTLIWQLAGHIVALSPKDGSLLWRYPAPLGKIDFLAGEERLLIFSGSQLMALSAEGTLAWTLKNKGSTTPVVSGHILYLLNEGQIHAYALKNGHLLWKEAAPGVIEAPIIHEGIVYLKNIVGKIQARNSRTGHLDWSRVANAKGKIRIGRDHIYWLTDIGLAALPLDGTGEVVTLTLPDTGDDSAGSMGHLLKDVSLKLVEKGIVLRLDGGKVVFLNH